MKPELIPLTDARGLCAHVAERWLQAVATAAAHGEPHRVALAGGRIAKEFMAVAAATAIRDQRHFGHVDFFWGDERCVPPDHPDSNFGLAAAALLRPLGIVEQRIHRVRGELDPVVAAQEAEAELRAVCPFGLGGQPVLDLVLLGMGEDGHVASLFPGAPVEATESSAAYVPVIGPKPPPQRVTLTYPAILAAKAVWVLVSGAAKERALRDSLSPNATTPLGRVLAARSATIFYAEVSQV